MNSIYVSTHLETNNSNGRLHLLNPPAGDPAQVSDTWIYDTSASPI